MIGISESSLPAELMREYTTLEYRLATQPPAVPPVFLFVIDTGLIFLFFFCEPFLLISVVLAIKHPDELEAMKASILRSFELIPPNAYVGLITYSQHVTPLFTESNITLIFISA